MRILTSLLLLLVTFISTVGFSNTAYVKFGSKSEALEYEPTDTIAAFKHTVGQAFSIPANRVRLIYAGAELGNDEEKMGTFSFTATTALILVLKNIAAGESSSADQTSSQLDYPREYMKPIERAKEAFKSMPHFNRLKGKSGVALSEEVAMIKGQMESILHYALPIPFMIELIARFPTEKGYVLFENNQLPLPHELMRHAIDYMRESRTISGNKGNDLETLKKYLTNAISFQIALAYFVFDEGESDLDNRFFKYDRTSFVEQYEEFERAKNSSTRSTSAYDAIREKIKNAHTTVTVKVYVGDQSFTIVGRRMDSISYLKQELARQVKEVQRKSSVGKFSLGVKGQPLETYPCPSHIEAKNKDQKMNDYSMFSDLEQFSLGDGIIIDAAAID